MWKNMPIFSLTLEERATCPSHCEQWNNCYGNNMPFGHRFDHTDPHFWPFLFRQLHQLDSKYPNGFVVRLHILGDFVDLDYTKRWIGCLEVFPNLHVFGYTHHRAKSDIGKLIVGANKFSSERWQVRFSDDTSTPFSTHVDKDIDGIDCPEQTGKTANCGTCGLCWSSPKPIVFMEH